MTTTTSEGLWSQLKTRPGRLFWLGCSLAVIGSAAMVWPQLAHLVIGGFAGWLLWLAGALMLGASLLMTGAKSFWPGVVSSLVAVAAGVFLLFNPAAGAIAVTLLVAAAFIVDGAFQLALALELRPLKIWRWILSSAMASVVAALMLAGGVFQGSTPAFGLMAGIAVLTTGLAFMALGDAARKA